MKVGRHGQAAPIACAWCGQRTLKRIKTQPHVEDGGVVEIRIYECTGDCREDHKTITREAHWQDGRYGRRYFAAQTTARSRGDRTRRAQLAGS